MVRFPRLLGSESSPGLSHLPRWGQRTRRGSDAALLAGSVALQGEPGGRGGLGCSRELGGLAGGRAGRRTPKSGAGLRAWVGGSVSWLGPWLPRMERGLSLGQVAGKRRLEGRSSEGLRPFPGS